MDYWDCNTGGVFLCHLHASLSLCSSLYLCSLSPLICYHLMSMTLLVRCATNITLSGRKGILARGKPNAT